VPGSRSMPRSKPGSAPDDPGHRAPPRCFTASRRRPRLPPPKNLPATGGPPIEATVAALARAREADRAKDKATCEQALAQAGRAIHALDCRACGKQRAGAEK